MCDELDDGPVPSVYAVTSPRARKPYQCYECCKTIDTGARYRRVFGVWYGEPGTYRQCGRCAKLLELLDAVGEPYAFYGAHEALRECVRNHGHDVLHRMREAYRKGVGKEWRVAS